MRTFFIAGALGILVVSLAACGGSSKNSAAVGALQRQADILAIDQIERSWHKATSRHDIDLMMSLWAQNATYTIGPGQTLTGKKEIRRFYLTQAAPFQPENSWVSDTPAYKIRTTVDGDKGTLYFECDFIDIKTSKVTAVVAADMDVAKIGGRWLITNTVSASPNLSP
jgi:ketosteroid isomerase-like protein